MKRKVLILSVVLSLLFAGIVSAATLWGSFKGFPIFKVTINGGAINLAKSPAVSIGGYRMVPESALKNVGITTTWDVKKQTLDIKQSPIDRTGIKSILEEAKKYGGSNVSFELSNGRLFAESDYYEKVGLNISDLRAFDDFNDIYSLANTLTRSGLDYVKVNYFSKNVKVGSLWTDSKVWNDYSTGKLTWEQFQRSWKIEGFTDYIKPTSATGSKTKLSIKEIAKLANAVGFVEIRDFNNNVTGSGSGFMIESGIFISNSHVGNNSFLNVKLDGITYDTKSYYLFNNQQTDIFGVILSTSYDANGRATGITPKNKLKYSTKMPEIGDTVYAIGSPRGLENTVSQGIVSGIRTIDGMTYIQHTANTDHGSSGGVLLNEYGEAIGITSMGIDGTSLDFAIPMSYVQDEINKLK